MFAGGRRLTLDWLVDVFPGWFAHRSWKLVLLVGKWSWSFTMWSSIGLLKCHHDMTSGDPRHSKLVAENVFYDLVLVATCHFHTILLVSLVIPINTRGNYQVCKYHEWESLWAMLEVFTNAHNHIAYKASFIASVELFDSNI